MNSTALNTPHLQDKCFILDYADGGNALLYPTGRHSNKALQVEAENPRSGKTYQAWLPRAALTRITTDAGTTYQIAKWFTPSGWTARFLELVRTDSSTPVPPKDDRTAALSPDRTPSIY